MNKVIVLVLVKVLSVIGKLSITSRQTYSVLMLPGMERFRWWVSQAKVWAVYRKASKLVPAYRDFLQKNGNSRMQFRRFTPIIASIPVTDKESYIKKYTVEEKCVDGKIPERGAVIDESSGSTGIPNNWVRGPEERKEVRKVLQYTFQLAIGKKPVFVINAFALGPWATGMNVSMSIVDIAILKSTGPDISKIINTLKLFGTKYKYVIMGYPPFLKTLVDSATDIDWASLDITVIFGGEGVSEGLRDYLLQYFKAVYGSYGASDLEINLAAENDFTIALRRQIERNPELRKRLTKTEYGVLPMIFQYSPYDSYMETNEHGELLISLCRKASVSPRLRYNIHDLGHVLRIPDLEAVIRELGVDGLPKPRVDLPLLFYYGRSDQAVAYYGCKITPGNVSDVLFSDKRLASIVNSFALITEEDRVSNKLLTFAFELGQDKREPSADEESRIKEVFFAKLCELNQDFRESYRMVREDLKPSIVYHAFGSGPFAKNDIRIKKHYIQQS